MLLLILVTIGLMIAKFCGYLTGCPWWVVFIPAELAAGLFVFAVFLNVVFLGMMRRFFNRL